MNRNAAGALLLMIGVAAFADDGSQATRNALLALDQELDKALISGDIPSLERIYADDYELITADGRVENKQERIERIRSGKDRDISPHVTDRSARVYGNTGLVLSRINPPAEHGTPMRSLRVFVRRDGKWQVVHAQVTPIGTHHPAR